MHGKNDPAYIYIYAQVGTGSENAKKLNNSTSRLAR
jgi:hypothetical protein